MAETLKNEKKIILYRSKDGMFNIDVKLEEETVWLTQKQISVLFNKTIPTINEHVKNIFKEGELKEKSVIRKFLITASDGKEYKTNFYNLDVIISVGYRVKSKEGTKFRIWASKILKEYLINGFSINQKRIHENGLMEFEHTIKLVKNAIKAKKLNNEEASGLLDIITNYADAWVMLQKYDQDKLKTPLKKKKPEYVLDYEYAKKSIFELKNDLVNKKQATNIFGNEREHSLEGILGNIYQTFNKKELYQSVEEKASHLLYFIIKDHPFTDGNKRIGSLLFILFLVNNNYLFNSRHEKKFNSNTLVAIALLVAESNPKQKETMIKLIMNFIAN